MDLDDVIRRLTGVQHGAVSARQLREAGMARHAIRRRVDSGMLVPVSSRVFVLGGSPSTGARRVSAAVLDAPDGAMLSHRSAAAWWNLPGFDLRSKLEVVVPRRGAPATTELAQWHYQGGLPAKETRVVIGVPVTSPALTLVHLGAVCHPARVERALNNALATRIVTLKGIRSLLALVGARGRNGVGVLRAILDELPADYVPPGSSLENRVLGLAEAAGVEVKAQIEIGDEEQWLGRTDMSLIGLPGVIEVQSVRYHGWFLDRIADEERFRRFRRAGFEVLAVWDEDVWQRPWEVQAAIIRFRNELLYRQPSVFAQETVRI